jgi:uncharacterized protein
MTPHPCILLDSTAETGETLPEGESGVRQLKLFPVSASPQWAWRLLAWGTLLFIAAHVLLFVRTTYSIRSFFHLVRAIYQFDTLLMPAIGLILGGYGLYASRRTLGHHWLRRVSWAVLGCSVLSPTIRFYAGQIEARHLVLRTVTIETPKVARPIRILHISDIQSDAVGKYEERVFARIRELHPDIVLCTGDLLQPLPPATLASEWPKMAQLFATLDAPGGVHMVIGDVDGLETQRLIAKNHVVSTISGDQTTQTFTGARLRIYGLSPGQDMKWHEAHRVIAEWREKTTPDEFTIVMGHHPDYSLAVRTIPVDLCLAGHTHGGQIRVPFLGPIITLSHVPRSWARGFHEIGATRLNVSAGIGCEHAAGLPSMRFCCPPEMTLIELRPVQMIAPRAAARRGASGGEEPPKNSF